MQSIGTVLVAWTAVGGRSGMSEVWMRSREVFEKLRIATLGDDHSCKPARVGFPGERGIVLAE